MGSSPTEGEIPDGEIGRRTGQKTGNLKLIKGLLQQKLKNALLMPRSEVRALLVFFGRR